MALLSFSPAIMSDSLPPAHPTDEAVAAYLEAALPDEHRARLEAHVTECEYCLARLALASRALDTAPRPRAQQRSRRIALVSLAAAAGLAGILLLSRSAAPPAGEPSEIRGIEQEGGAAPIHPLAPLRGTTVGLDSLRFIWSDLGSQAMYQVTLSAADGEMLWSQRTADTIGAPPPGVRSVLKPGQRYFWRVDALLPDLRSVTSGDQSFQVTFP